MTVAAPALTRVGGRVATLTAPGTLILDEVTVPAAEPGEALVRIVASGICGTDIHAFKGRSDRLPMTLGHDAVGIVEQVGGSEDPAGLLGRRVTIDPMVSCGTCTYCIGGLAQLCPRGGYLGMTSPGTMADYLCLPAANLVPLTDEVTDVDATVLEPIAVALHLLERIGGFAPEGRHADVIGGGPLGLLLAQTLVANGWMPTVYEPQEQRRALGVTAGLDVRDPSAAVAEDGPVLVVETSASAAGVEVARMLATPGSVVGLVGRAPAEFTSAEILLKELSVLGIKTGLGHYPESIRLVGTGQVTPGAMVTHHYTLADIGDAFAGVTDPAGSVMRAVVHSEAQ